jgi:hypothetical protein
MPINIWHESFAEPTFADAILDMLLQNASHIEQKGLLMRKQRNIQHNEN